MSCLYSIDLCAFVSIDLCDEHSIGCVLNIMHSRQERKDYSAISFLFSRSPGHLLHCSAHVCG